MIFATVPTYTPSPIVTSQEMLTDGKKAEYFFIIVSCPTVHPRFSITKSSILMLVDTMHLRSEAQSIPSGQRVIQSKVMLFYFCLVLLKNVYGWNTIYYSSIGFFMITVLDWIDFDFSMACLLSMHLILKPIQSFSLI